jgi:hypothetical protein
VFFAFVLRQASNSSFFWGGHFLVHRASNSLFSDFPEAVQVLLRTVPEAVQVLLRAVSVSRSSTGTTALMRYSNLGAALLRTSRVGCL